MKISDYRIHIIDRIYPRSIRSRLIRLSAAIACWVATPLTAQTLDEQYEFYLSSACEEMQFVRDGFFNLLPGQAGPQMTAACNGPPPVGGGGAGNAGSGGGAGVATGVSVDDSVLRRRRDAARTGKSADSQDTIATYGNLGLFLSFDYLHQRQDDTHYEDARKSIMRAGTLGVDYRFSKGLIGLAGRYEDTGGTFDTGGDFETRGQGVSLYGSWFVFENAFIDLTVSANFRNDEARRVVSLSRSVVSGGGPSPFDLMPAFANSDKDSTEYGAQLSAGYDFVMGGFTLGPRVTAATLRNTQDAYIENGQTAMTLTFDEQEETSTRGAVGVQAGTVFTPSFGVLTLQVNADWQHEFDDDQQTFTARFAEDLRAAPKQLRFQNEPPDRDVYLARASLVATLPHGIGAFVSGHRQFGHEYQSRYGGSIGVRKAF